MTKRFFFKRVELALAIAVAVLFTYAAAAGAMQRDVAEKVLRLHVVANSDSVEDQRVKLCVRDAVLSYCTPLLTGVQSQDEVREVLSGHMQQIVNVAQRTLWEEGSQDMVRGRLRAEYYPTRDYTDFSLPAGRYAGLRLEIGAAEGHNWWCVIFPPLCDGAARTETEDDGLTGEERAFTRRDGTRYVVRFKAAELVGELRQWLAG